MSTLSFPTQRALNAQAKDRINALLIDTSRISDEEINRQARLVNKAIMGFGLVLSEWDKQLSQSKLDIRGLEASVLKEGVMQIDKRGILQLSSAFFISTKFEKGIKFLPGRSDDPKDKGYYLIESSSGLRLGERGIDISGFLDAVKITYPNRVLWGPLKSSFSYEGRKAFRIEFPETLYH